MFSFSSLEGSGPAPIILTASRSKAAAQPSSRPAQPALEPPKPAARHTAAAAAAKRGQQGGTAAAGSSKPSCNASVRKTQQAGKSMAPLQSTSRVGGKGRSGPPLQTSRVAPDARAPVALKCMLDRRGITGKGLEACSSNARAAGNGKPKLAMSLASARKPLGAGLTYLLTCQEKRTIAMLLWRSTHGRKSKATLSKSACAVCRVLQVPLQEPGLRQLQPQAFQPQGRQR